MTSTILIVCHKCGHERPITRDEIITGRWKHAPCPGCGHVRAGANTPCKLNYPMHATDVTAGNAR